MHVIFVVTGLIRKITGKLTCLDIIIRNIKIFNYWDRQVLADSSNPDQTAHVQQSDQRLPCCYSEALLPCKAKISFSF